MYEWQKDCISWLLPAPKSRSRELLIRKMAWKIATNAVAYKCDPSDTSYKY